MGCAYGWVNLAQTDPAMLMIGLPEGTPMMLMTLAKGASIISIIAGPFLHFWLPLISEIVSQPYPKSGFAASF